MNLNRKSHNHNTNAVAETDGKSFAPHYLAVKKSIDDEALNHRVWKTLSLALPQAKDSGPVNILEIGTGIGTMFERLVDGGLLTGHSHYLGTDMDPLQLQAARKYLSTWAVKHGHSWLWSQDGGRLNTTSANISLTLARARAEELAKRSDSLGPFHLLLAHAVLDLVDFPAVLPQLLSRLSSKGLAYFTCNFDGETIFLPEDAGDGRIVKKYHDSMEARLAGASQTGRRLLGFLHKLGLEILAVGSSDWVIHPRRGEYTGDEISFLYAILETIRDELARNDTSPADHAALAKWVSLRRRQVANGTLCFLARHLDVLVRGA